MKKVLTSTLILICGLSFAQNITIDDLWKLYNSNDVKSVIEKVQPLYANDPDNIDLNLMLGRSYADLGDFKNALPYLEVTVKTDTANSWQKAWALSYLGSCYYMLQDYSKSESSIKECIALNVTRNATKISYDQCLLFGFHDFYKTWKTFETVHFRFHFQNTDSFKVENYISEREEAFNQINTFFKSTLPKKIDFYVWASRDDAMKILRTNLGFARTNFCLVHTHYRQTIGHEMTHIISNSSEITNKTKFINEGTAVCFDLSDKDRLQLVKDWIAKNNKPVAIKDCWLNGDQYAADILYPLSGLFVKELIENFGKDKFLEFFKNQTYENAKLVFGDTFELLIKDFEKRINS